ncbi:oligopeptide/dipeptide ABC transporter ATP-binding protein [Aquabacter sp. CN5-332]|uniref:ABC transporter ATP-binding protein n=1 Tax=Aquabacter sp. CN5-332 TaxID=3156608 RepID=UPI0032B35711
MQDLQERVDRGGPAQPLVIARGLTKHFPLKRGFFGGEAKVKAADGVDFEIIKGETLAIVGESGCGKSTLSRLVMGMIPPTSGEVVFDGELVGSTALRMNDFHRQVQMVFQDSYSSLNPRLSIEESIAFPPMVHGLAHNQAVARAHELLEAVGLSPTQYARRYPHELSGGQRQRVNIARALALRPRLVILDEPVSALDKSVEAQVLNLLIDLKAQFKLTYLFISHDLNVVHHMADRVLVMYLGRVAEIGPVEEVFRNPAHPYTRALLASRPSMDPRRRRAGSPLSGDPPNPIDPPPGCRFMGRCTLAEPVCATVLPELSDIGTDAAGETHAAACLAVLPSSGHSLATRMVA